MDTDPRRCLRTHRQPGLDTALLNASDSLERVNAGRKTGDEEDTQAAFEMDANATSRVVVILPIAAAAVIVAMLYSLHVQAQQYGNARPLQTSLPTVLPRVRPQKQHEINEGSTAANR